jgi:hypothetical protein
MPGGGTRRLDGAADAPRRSARRGARGARSDVVPGASQGLGGVGSRRSERCGGDAARGRDRPVGVPADPRLRRPARGVRAPPPGRPRRFARAHRPARVRRQLDGRRALRERRQDRPRRRVRPGERAGAPAQPHARLRRQKPQARSLAAPSPGVAVRVGRLRLLRPPRRAGVRLRDDVRARSARQTALVATDLGVGRRGGCGARLLERGRGPPRRQVPRPRRR